ncbi:MAG: heme lyase CcmF/NrfE family subunit [Wolbachia sp.]
MPELGNILLLIACLLSLTYLFLPLSSYWFITTAIFFCVSTSIAILIYCHITNDFSLENVYYHSHTTKPLIYKICGVWGNKEGSMLLWTLVLVMYLLLMDIYIPSVIPVSPSVIPVPRHWDPDNLIANEYIKWQCNKNWIPVSSTGMTPERTNGSKLKKISLITHGLICFCFLLFTLLESNPFTKMPGVEKDGLGFNPILQDIGLAIHPPILYLGYLGFSVPFSLSIAGLIANTEGNVWAKIVRPWVLISWSLLTLGISLGSWWAYRELGWGGFWFWDPVENVSLMPWLIAVALTHLLLVVRNFNTLRNFAILLTLTTFILSVTGTFLVRSGILTSVHTFADDPRYGLYILALLGVITVSSLVIFVVFTRKNHTSFQYSTLESEKKSATQVTEGRRFFSRLTMMLMNNLLFITAFFIVFVGTLYPTVLEYLTGELISVGAPYYNSLFNSIALAILVLTMIGQYCRWQGNSLLPIFHEYRFSFCSAAAILPFIFHMELIIVLSITISIALLIFVLEAYSKRICLFKVAFGESILLARRVSKSYYAMMLAHAGVAILVLGIAYSVGWQEKKENYLKIGDSITVNKFKVTLQNIELIKEKNFHAVRGTMDIRNLLNNKILGEVTPEYRFYLAEGQKNVESSIYHNLLSDIYVVIGEIDKSKSKIAAKAHYKPGMSIIWLGSFLIAFGSLLAAFPLLRRF